LAKLLEIDNLAVHYDKAIAIEDVSLNLDDGEIVSIVGANGAGKTTVIRAISGLKKPTSGKIWFQGKRIDGMPAYDIVKRGISQIPAGRQIFPTMSVLDNLKVGSYLRKDQDRIKKDLEGIYQHFPILKERHAQMGGQLSGGQQQMLAIARALMAAPKLLLMDEPSMGLAPILVAEVGKIIQDINQQGISILLVEQNARMALKLAKRTYILELGKVALKGNCEDLINNDEVKRYYLGGT
jgi:branched-chain amino acid transport system ATP-binding protein